MNVGALHAYVARRCGNGFLFAPADGVVLEAGGDRAGDGDELIAAVPAIGVDAVVEQVAVIVIGQRRGILQREPVVRIMAVGRLRHRQAGTGEAAALTGAASRRIVTIGQITQGHGALLVGDAGELVDVVVTVGQVNAIRQRQAGAAHQCECSLDETRGIQGCCFPGFHCWWQLLYLCHIPSRLRLLELAALYHERWEVEAVFDELKTHLGARRRTLRSKTPTGVRQKFYGWILAHYAVCWLMHAAASLARFEQRRLSFTGHVHLLRRAQPRSGAFPPSATQT